jgi:DNA-binding XRE family transcriptional regulator
MSRKLTVGQKLWLSLRDANELEQQAAAMAHDGGEKTPEAVSSRWARRWNEGMSRHLKRKFPEKLLNARQGVGITQQQLSEIANLSVTGVAMIERGERLPNLDTAARICWALDVAAGVTPEQLS